MFLLGLLCLKKRRERERERKKRKRESQYYTTHSTTHNTPHSTIHNTTHSTTQHGVFPLLLPHLLRETFQAVPDTFLRGFKCFDLTEAL